MIQTREISALLQLIDDPDEEVYQTVRQRLMDYGQAIIPSLESLWDENMSGEAIERIEMIIHQLHFNGLQEQFVNWKKGESELLYGALLVAKYQYPDLKTLHCLQEIERIRRNIWLEMNAYMTPLEQVKVMESIFYNYYEMKGGEVNYSKPNEFLLHKVLDGKKGNTISTGILYLILAALLDLPVKAVKIPRQFVLGWFNVKSLYNNDFTSGNPDDFIKFFIDPNTGVPFSNKEIELYYKRIDIEPKAHHFKPLTNVQIIKALLLQLASCFDKPDLLYKKKDLETLAGLLDN